ncbi:hypothetical protein [Streptomyces sp. NPDC046860]|uniref:hypothetical protein n=1 Tax=Streptomyces sp. NPDC046860 TaxID=3154495 RepID=UPI003411D597
MASSPSLQLTTDQQCVADLLAQGVHALKIPSRSGLGLVVVNAALHDLRCMLGCPDASRAVLANLLIVNDLVDPPRVPPGPEPTLSHGQLSLMAAVATNSALKDIARASSMPRAQLDWELPRLFAATGSANRLQVVVRGHGWGLLGASSPNAAAQEACP